jgi:hypothetical protein
MVRFGRITQQEYRVALGLEPRTPPAAGSEAEPTPVAGPATLESTDDDLVDHDPAPEPPPADAVPPIELTEPAADLTEPEPVISPSPPAENADGG